MLSRYQPISLFLSHGTPSHFPSINILRVSLFLADCMPCQLVFGACKSCVSLGWFGCYQFFCPGQLFSRGLFSLGSPKGGTERVSKGGKAQAFKGIASVCWYLLVSAGIFFKGFISALHITVCLMHLSVVGISLLAGMFSPNFFSPFFFFLLILRHLCQ